MTAASQHWLSISSPLSLGARRVAGCPPGLWAHVLLLEGASASLRKSWTWMGLEGLWNKPVGQGIVQEAVCLHTQLPPGFSPLT